MQKHRRGTPTFAMPIPKGAIGRVIGAKGANIQKMKKMEGVHNVWVDPDTCSVDVFCNSDVVDKMKAYLGEMARFGGAPVPTTSVFVLDMPDHFTKLQFLSSESYFTATQSNQGHNRVPLYPTGIEAGEIVDEASSVHRIPLGTTSFELCTVGLNAPRPDLNAKMSDAILAFLQDRPGQELDLEFSVGQTTFMANPADVPFKSLDFFRNDPAAFSQLAPVFSLKLKQGIASSVEKRLLEMTEWSVRDEEKAIVHLTQQSSGKKFSFVMLDSGTAKVFERAPSRSSSFLSRKGDEKKHICFQIVDNVEVLAGRLNVRSWNSVAFDSLDPCLEEALCAAWNERDQTAGVMNVECEDFFIDCARTLRSKHFSDGQIDIAISQVAEKLPSCLEHEVSEHEELEFKSPPLLDELNRVLTMDLGNTTLDPSSDTMEAASVLAERLLEFVRRARELTTKLTAEASPQVAGAKWEK